MIFAVFDLSLLTVCMNYSFFTLIARKIPHLPRNQQN